MVLNRLFIPISAYYRNGKVELSIDNFKAVDRNEIKDLPHILEVLLGWMTTSQTNNRGQHYRIIDPFSSKSKLG